MEQPLLAVEDARQALRRLTKRGTAPSCNSLRNAPGNRDRDQCVIAAGSQYNHFAGGVGEEQTNMDNLRSWHPAESGTATLKELATP
jgi:hypothetical protein